LKQYLRGSYNKLRATNILSNFFNLSSIQISNTLLLILIIPIITRVIGIEEFGIIMFASRFSQLAGAVVNYGTSQSGVRDVAANLEDIKKLSIVYYNTLCIRTFIFLLFLILLLGLQHFHIKYYTYILLSVPIVLAEVLNPLFFYIGTERLRVFNIVNLASNVLCILLLALFIKKPNDSVSVNFILGSVNALTYLGLLIYAIPQFKISFYLPLKKELLKIGKDNFYLTVNNISVHLQQSIMIFALTKWGNTSLLGAYSLCDRIIGQCRNLLITISNALYPNSVHYYKQSTTLWNVYRKKIKYLVASVFLAGSILLYLLADFVVYTLTKEHNAIAVVFLRTMAIVPTVAALNFSNVLDQLLKNNTVYIFRIALILFIVSLMVAYTLLNFGNFMFIGTFTLIIETSALIMYEYTVKKTTLKNV